MPFPDFNLCIALLERPVVSNLDEPDPLPELLPTLSTLHELLLQCRFPAFWELYKSVELQNLRENYTVECNGFEDSIRNVVIKSVKSTFKKINVVRLGTYLDLDGTLSVSKLCSSSTNICLGEDLVNYVSNLGWTVDGPVVTVAANPDNQIEATVVRENIHLPREFFRFVDW